MSEFAPFQNESQAIDVGGLLVENRLDRVSLSGDVDLTMDVPGLAHARKLKTVIDAVVRCLESGHSLPAQVTAEPATPSQPHNPFA